MQLSNIINTRENPVNVTNTKRQNVLCKIRNKTIDGNNSAYLSISGNYKIDVSDYLFIYAVVQTDSSHSFALDMYPRYLEKTSGVKEYPYSRIIDITGVVARTDWIETYSDIIGLELVNYDSNSHVYDVTIFGVR